MYASEEGEVGKLALASVICSMLSWKSGFTEAGKSSVQPTLEGGAVERGKRSILGKEPARNSMFSMGSCLVLVWEIKKAIPVI